MPRPSSTWTSSSPARQASGVVDIRLPIGENIRKLAGALDKPVDEIVVSVLNRPRHEQLIQEIRDAGAGTRLMSDGDVAGGINAARHDARTDMCVGVGGSPEGIVTACAIKALGGHIQGRLWPRDDDERQRGIDAGLDMDKVYEADDLVQGNNTIFVATGVTGRPARRRVSVVNAATSTPRASCSEEPPERFVRIASEHLVSKWL